MAFTATNKAPGVYIDEVQLPGPIAGVATNVAAFVGPAKRGPINKPIFLTNWTQFAQVFGDPDGQGGYDPYRTNPDVFVTHAVRGFFDNGGTTCYFVRVSNGKAASLLLPDRSGTAQQPGPAALKITAKREGAAGNSITVEVANSHISSTKAVRAQVTIAAPPAPAQANFTVTNPLPNPLNLVKLTPEDALKFKPNDSVKLVSGQQNENATIKTVAQDGTITFTNALAQINANGTMTLIPPEQAGFTVVDAPFNAPNPANQVTVAAADVPKFRPNDPVNLVSGQTNETATIATVDPNTNVITFTTNLATVNAAGKMKVLSRISVTPGDTAKFKPEDFVILRWGQQGIATATVKTVEPNGSIGFVDPLAATTANGAISSVASKDSIYLSTSEDAKKFLPGDALVVGGNATEKAIVATTNAVKGTITFTANLARSYVSGTARTADLAPGQTTIRVEDVAGLEPGTCLTISQANNPVSTEDQVVASVQKITKVVTLTRGLQNSYSMRPNDPDVTLTSNEFTLTISPSPPITNLSMDFRHSRYFLKILKQPEIDRNLNAYVELPDTPSPTPPPDNLPQVTAGPQNLAGGAPEDLATIREPEYRAGIDALRKFDDVNLLCVPDGADFPTVQRMMIDHCELLQDRFAILDPSSKAVLLDADHPENTIKSQLEGDGTPQNPGLGSDGGYAALYFPRVVIDHPVVPGQTLTVPPSGHLAGLFAHIADTRGVHKAPANEVLKGVLSVDPKSILTDDEQGPLNEIGINVIRFQKGRGVVCMGARTVSTRTQWRYVSTRRLVLFIEKSIQKGTQFAVFEPNELSLWQKIKRQVTDFLTRVWKDGALFGATADQAFRVKVDEELNPPDVRALGQLVIEVVVIPSFPAEFVVFRIIQDPTGAALKEK